MRQIVADLSWQSVMAHHTANYFHWGWRRIALWRYSRQTSYIALISQVTPCHNVYPYTFRVSPSLLTQERG